MSNLIEVLPGGSSHTTPGWTYVPAAGYDGGTTERKPKPTGGRKRAAREAGTAAAAARSDTSSKQHAATLRYLAELDRENHKDVHIPVPTKRKENAASKGPRSKTTSNVRRILTSQKTFKNYLDDEEAALAQSGTPAATAPRPNLPKAGRSAAVSPRSSVPNTPKPPVPDTQSTATPSASTPVTTITTTAQPQTPATTQQQQEQTPQLIASDGDNDPLLRSYIPKPPSDRIMQQLLAEPPLSYNAARAKLPPETDSAPRKPRRYFCGICGYWGRIKCVKCGARVCGLDCHRVHEETRCLRFYA